MLTQMKLKKTIVDKLVSYFRCHPPPVVVLSAISVLRSSFLYLDSLFFLSSSVISFSSDMCGARTTWWST